ncbi:xanthine dehydrogenase accessory protein XdhC [Aliiglaciecola litoralis]|uniref:Xanthine dehydrogenase accessory protein XdhC n=1 Tax=Aliiglaciecola litoralis TaxID=582857 RepID=A0ABN1LC09_9ALTE
MQSHNWYEGIDFCQTHGKAYILLTVMGSVGSTPRAAGTKMVVTDDRTFDTIGGGHLEHAAIKQARAMLSRGETHQHVEHFPLGAKLAQCCGGATHVLFEPINIKVPVLAIFGAGHVAKALLPIVSQLPVSIKWVDNRAEQFDGVVSSPSVEIIIEEEPVDVITQIDRLSHMLVMTHNHQLDFDLVVAGLAQPNINYLGLIGSQTKARRFVNRLAKRNICDKQMDKLVCPVGLLDVTGKRPIEVAVSIAGQLIQQFNANQPSQSSNKQQRINWQQTKEIIEFL